MKTRNVMMSGLVLGLLATAVHANPHGGMLFSFHPTAAEMTKIDTNADGRISQTEITAARTAEFATINTVVADDVTFAEFSAFATKQQTAKLTSLDTSNDGKLSVEEFSAPVSADVNAANVATEIFDLADSNDDKALSAAEFNVLLPNAGGAIYQFTHLDSNHDLVISQAEYLATPSKQGGAMLPPMQNRGGHGGR
jgi:hypothetical protein